MKTLLLFSLLGTVSVQAGEEVSLRVVDTAAPPGGIAIVVVELTEPQPISQGQLCLSFSTQGLASPNQVAVFPNGIVNTQVTFASNTVLLDFVSPDSSFGTDDDVPLAILAFPVPITATPGDRFKIRFDSVTEMLDPQGQPYDRDFDSGTFTVGGYSIEGMTPSSGFVPRGEKIVFSGQNFPWDLRIDIEGTGTDTRVVNPTRAEVTVEDDFTLEPATRLRFRRREVDDGLPRIFAYPLLFSQDGFVPQAQEEPQPNLVESLFAPLVVSGGGWSTEVNLINAGDAPLSASLRLVDDTGSPLGGFLVSEPIPLELGAGRQWVGRIGDLFGLSSLDVRAGGLIVESDSPLVGGVLISGEAPSGATALALLDSPVSSATARLRFGGSLGGQALLAGMALQNPAEETAEIVLTAYAGDGTWLAQGQLSLPGRERRFRLLTDWIPDLPPEAGGYFTLESSRPVLAVQIVTDTDFGFFSVVELSPR